MLLSFILLLVENGAGYETLIKLLNQDTSARYA